MARAERGGGMFPQRKNRLHKGAVPNYFRRYLAAEGQ